MQEVAECTIYMINSRITALACAAAQDYDLSPRALKKLKTLSLVESSPSIS